MSSPIDTLLASSDEEIHQQIMSLSNLRAKRNSVLPVFHLLPEILAIIFIHGARDYYESDDGPRSTPCLPTWVNVSYVCSHWRNIALNSPTLWTFHFNVSLRWTEELLLRSKEAPLKISCIYPSHHSPGTFWGENLLDELLKHSGRIQELCLFAIPYFLPDRLHLCLPRLEKLEMNFNWVDSKRSITITGGDEPLLHTLKLHHCSLSSLSWHSFNLTRLKSLSLCYVQSSSTALNMAEFLTTLNYMRNLTVLHIEYTLPSARSFLSSGSPSVTPEVSLPCLSVLEVTAPLSTTVALVSCLNIPSSVHLSLGLLLEPGSTLDHFVPIHSFLTHQFCDQSSAPIFRSLLLETSCHFTLTFGLDHEPPPEEGDYDVHLRISLGEVNDGEDTDEMTDPPDMVHILGNILSSLPVRNIQSIHVRWSRCSSDFWRAILGCLDGLRRMKLSYGDMPDLSLLALPARKSDEKALTSCHMFVPALEELELYRIMFAFDHTPMGGGVSRQSLFDILSTRKGLWDRLTMFECGPMDGSIF